MADRLCEQGVEIDAEAVIRRAAGGTVGRVHVAQEVIRQGHCKSLPEVFDRYIGFGGPAYVAKDEMSPEECIGLVHAAGGCSVLCHAGYMEQFALYVEQFAALGLDALEVHYPTHSDADEAALLDLARRFGLGVTGGSDFHGDAKPQVALGQETVSFVELEDLRRRTAAPA
jgi:predicted metal-dependent phosphoesterase TrpH